MTGAGELAIAGGVEHMPRIPMGAGVNPNPRLLEMFPAGHVPDGDDGRAIGRDVPDQPA